MTSKSQNLQIEISKLKNENIGLQQTINRLTNDYNNYRKESDEIFKGYEDAIQFLSESLDKMQLENNKLKTEKEKVKIDYDKSLKELEKLREKNKEK